MKSIDEEVARIGRLMVINENANGDGISLIGEKGQGTSSLEAIREKLEKKGFDKQQNYVCKLVTEYSLGKDDSITYKLNIHITNRV